MSEVVGASPREVVVRELNSMRGRLLAVIESIGLPAPQEESIKSLIKNLSFQNQAVILKVIEDLDTDGVMYATSNGKLVETLEYVAN